MSMSYQMPRLCSAKRSWLLQNSHNPNFGFGKLMPERQKG